MRRLLIFFVLLLFGAIRSYGQQVSPLTDNFAFTVHSIDDFFDRFNFRLNVGLRRYLKVNYPDVKLTREKLIASLFDNQKLVTGVIDADTLGMFIRSSENGSAAHYLYYEDDHWYAVIKCRVLLNHKPMLINLVMKVETTDQRSYKWVIAAVSSAALSKTTIKPGRKSTVLTAENGTVPSGHKHYSLSPVSHGIDFSNIDRVFLNKGHVADYFRAGEWTPDLKNFAYLVNTGQLQFVGIRETSYYLFQLDGWIVKVRHFDRQSHNAGWLVSDLIAADSLKKTRYALDKLNLSNF